MLRASLEADREGWPSGLGLRVVLVRHAAAGDRDSWAGADRLRPLDERGRRQAAGLVPILTSLGVDRLVSSPYVRCVQTLEPAAAALHTEVEEREELAEGVSVDTVLGLIGELVDSTPALSTHGDVAEALIGVRMPKGGARVLESSDGDVRLGEAFPPPG
jgi:phosphohistidine phosphatase SixA